MVLTGTRDGYLCLYDLRNFTRPVAVAPLAPMLAPFSREVRLARFAQGGGGVCPMPWRTNKACEQACHRRQSEALGVRTY